MAETNSNTNTEQQQTPPAQTPPTQIPPETPPAQITPELQQHIDKLVQSAADKVRTEYAGQLKKLQADYDALAKSKMTDDEKAKFDIEQAQKQLDIEKAQFEKQQNQNYAISKLVSNGFIDADENGNLLTVDLVMGDSKDDIEKRVNNLKAIVDSRVKKEVEEKFKNAGRDLQYGAGGGKTTNNFGVQLAQKINARQGKQKPFDPWATK